MKSNELREKFLNFFKEKGHTIIPPASLIPENDPTVLFTTAGMHPLVPFLLGEKHPGGKKLTGVQPCIRTGDIDEVGDVIHHTFFEMMGNWSLGDYFEQSEKQGSDQSEGSYFKKESIEMSFEFLTSKKWLNLDKNKLAISIFEGDQDAPRDDESEKVWLDLGVSKDRIKGLPKKDNWWGPAGQTGPCGADTEIFYWVGSSTGSGQDVPDEFDPDDDRWVEIWNNVFMEYYKKEDGKYEPLKQKNVDTGMGFERMLAVLNNLDDDYQTDVFLPIIKKIEKISGKKYEDNKKEFRIIADHVKAATLIIGDKNGAEPSNVGRGYVLRRLIRRAIRYGKNLGIKDVFTFKLSQVVANIYHDVYPNLRREKVFIEEQLVREEEKFKAVLEEGLKKAEKIFLRPP